MKMLRSANLNADNHACVCGSSPPLAAARFTRAIGTGSWGGSKMIGVNGGPGGTSVASTGVPVSRGQTGKGRTH
jgi:hypothetical protein